MPPKNPFSYLRSGDKEKQESPIHVKPRRSLRQLASRPISYKEDSSSTSSNADGTSESAKPLRSRSVDSSNLSQTTLFAQDINRDPSKDPLDLSCLSGLGSFHLSIPTDFESSLIMDKDKDSKPNSGVSENPTGQSSANTGSQDTTSATGPFLKPATFQPGVQSSQTTSSSQGQTSDKHVHSAQPTHHPPPDSSHIPDNGEKRPQPQNFESCKEMFHAVVATAEFHIRTVIAAIPETSKPYSYQTYRMFLDHNDKLALCFNQTSYLSAYAKRFFSNDSLIDIFSACNSEISNAIKVCCNYMSSNKRNYSRDIANTRDNAVRIEKNIGNINSSSETNPNFSNTGAPWNTSLSGRDPLDSSNLFMSTAQTQQNPQDSVSSNPNFSFASDTTPVFSGKPRPQTNLFATTTGPAPTLGANTTFPLNAGNQSGGGASSFGAAPQFPQGPFQGQTGDQGNFQQNPGHFQQGPPGPPGSNPNFPFPQAPWQGAQQQQQQPLFQQPKFVKDLKPHILSHSASMDVFITWKELYRSYFEASNLHYCTNQVQFGTIMVNVDTTLNQYLRKHGSAHTPTFGPQDNVKLTPANTWQASFMQLLNAYFEFNNPIHMRRAALFQMYPKAGQTLSSHVEKFYAAVQNCELEGITAYELAAQFLINTLPISQLRSDLLNRKHCPNYEQIFQKVKKFESSQTRLHLPSDATSSINAIANANSSDSSDNDLPSVNAIAKGKGKKNKNANFSQISQQKQFTQKQNKRTGQNAKGEDKEYFGCYRCNKMGHFPKDCPFLDKNCARCKKVGHAPNQCPSRGPAPASFKKKKKVNKSNMVAGNVSAKDNSSSDSMELPSLTL